MAAATARQDAHDLGDEDVTAIGGTAEPGRLHHRRAEAVTVLEGHVTGRDPHADRKLELVVAGVQVDRSLHGHSGSDGLGRAGEHDEHAIAEALDHRAAVCLGRVDERAVVLPTHHLRAFLAELRAELGRADEVADEDRRRLGGHDSSDAPAAASSLGANRPRPARCSSIVLRTIH